MPCSIEKMERCLRNIMKNIRQEFMAVFYVFGGCLWKTTGCFSSAYHALNGTQETGVEQQVGWTHP